ncbi:MAG: PBP1A family penicillin-binding protein [Desulfomonilaceae bacterium]
MISRHTNKQKKRTLITVFAWLGAGLPVLMLCGFVSGMFGAVVGSYLAFSADLPKIPDLKSYRPKTVSTFYAEDGSVIGLFYRQKRFPVSLDSLPSHVINAFLAAEDSRFFSHSGVDLLGILRALVKNVKSGTFAQGGSTITQQVTRNFLLSNEKTISRKIREAILASRLERTLGKKEILGIYLNEIYLGKGSYGVEAAARTYFGKPAAEMSIAEAALVAGLVSNPTKYSPARSHEAALKRREFVLDRMLHDGFINENQYRDAMADVPSFREDLPNPYQKAPYFTEAVRQYILARYGEDELYNQGLQVWTACDTALQNEASEALVNGARSWEKREGRPVGLVRRLKPSEAKEFRTSSAAKSYTVGELIQAIVISNDSPKKRRRKQSENNIQVCTLALRGDLRFRMRLESNIRYRTNDLLEFRITKIDGTRLDLEHQPLPRVQGAVVCIENNTGYVRALVGGLGFDRSSFNRAIQAKRQPGSAFKPFLYAAALEWGRYSPHTLIVDEPIAVVMDSREPEWVPKNSDRQFNGPMTFRQALAHSRNIISVKLLMDVGIDPVIQMARNMGIHSPLRRNLSLSLGASEVTPLELTSAYTVFPNMGVRVTPVLVKKVVDRFGNVLEDNSVKPLNVLQQITAGESPGIPSIESPTSGVTARGSGYADQMQGGLIDQMRNIGSKSQGSSTNPNHAQRPAASLQSEPASHDPRMVRVLSPQSAYLMVSILRDTCVSGTAAAAARLHRKDLAGKTGTTDDCTDAWFVGFNQKYTTGVWMGYDGKVSLGRQEYGGAAALPVWMDFMRKAIGSEPSVGYPVPNGIVFGGAVIPAGTHPNLNALLEASPDFAFQPDIKQVSPVDTAFVPAAANVEDTPDSPSNTDSVAPAYPGAIRVLSPTGQTLGYALYEVDGKGKVTLYRDTVMTDNRNEEGAGREARSDESFFTGAAKFLRNFPSSVPSSVEGWFQ